MSQAKKKRRIEKNRMGKNQIETLIEYMEEHTLFARRQIMKLGPEGKQNHKKMWGILTNKLNEIGPAKKTVGEWQKSWKDMRLAAKSQKAQYMTALNKTGYKEPQIKPNNNVLRISDIYGIYGMGLCVLTELGFPKCKIVTNDVQIPPWIDELHSCIVTLQKFMSSIPDFMTDSLQHLQKNLDGMVYANNDDRFLHKSRTQKRVIQKPKEAQITMLIEFMEIHPELARNECATDDDADKLWEEIIHNLNMADGVSKPAKGWKKTWSDLITTSRQSVKYFSTGRKNTSVSEHHERVVVLVGYKNYDKGIDLEEDDEDASQEETKFLIPPKKFKFDTKYHVETSQPVVDLTDETDTALSSQKPSAAFQKPPITKQYLLSLPKLTKSNLAMSASASKPPTSSTFKPSMSASTSQSSTEASTSQASMSASASKDAKERSALFLKTLEEKGSNLVTTLADHFIQCFEKQNKVLKESFEAQNMILKSLAKIIGDQFTYALINLNSTEEETKVAVKDDEILNNLDTVEEADGEEVNCEIEEEPAEEYKMENYTEDYEYEFLDDSFL